MTDNHADLINANLGGFNEAMGLCVLTASGDEVVAEWTVKPIHHQPYGIVHGGVHAGVIEALCSIGAALFAFPKGQSVVGLDNHTSFLKAVREGKLTCTALPMTRGRRSQLWEGTVRDEDGRRIAVGQVRLLCLDADAQLAGQAVPGGASLNK